MKNSALGQDRLAGTTWNNPLTLPNLKNNIYIYIYIFKRVVCKT